MGLGDTTTLACIKIVRHRRLNRGSTTGKYRRWGPKTKKNNLAAKGI